MRSLISLALVALPLASAARADADAPRQGEASSTISRRGLVARSVAAALTHRIASRSTGKHAQRRAPAVPGLTPTVVRPGVEPEVAASRPDALPAPAIADPLSPRPADTEPTRRAKGKRARLDRRVLDRLGRYGPLIERYSRMHDVEPNLVRAVIYVESGAEPYATSGKGALGLMQLMPGTATDMGVSNPVDPAQNIYGGTRYLSWLLGRFERLDLALWGYNAGPDRVERRRLPAETRRYIPEVLRVKSLLDEQKGT